MCLLHDYLFRKMINLCLPGTSNDYQALNFLNSTLLLLGRFLSLLPDNPYLSSRLGLPCVPCVPWHEVRGLPFRILFLFLLLQ